MEPVFYSFYSSVAAGVNVRSLMYLQFFDNRDVPPQLLPSLFQPLLQEYYESQNESANFVRIELGMKLGFIHHFIS